MPRPQQHRRAGERLGTGRTAEIFAWGDDAVLKLFRPNWPAELARREAEQSRLVHGAGLPAPRVLDVVEVDGRQGVVFERLVGPSLLQELAGQPWQLGRLARELADLHTEVTSQVPAGMGSLSARLRQTLTTAETVPADVRQLALARLDNPVSPESLCHGDFHPDNVIRTPRGLMIIDWPTAGLADPAYDVARSRLLASVGVPVRTVSAGQRVMIAAGRQLFTRAYVRRLCRRHGWPVAAIDDWDLVAIAIRFAEDIDAEVPLLTARAARRIELTPPPLARDRHE